MLEEEIEDRNGIEIALFFLEGESSNSWDHLEMASTNKQRELCCSLCNASNIKIKLNNQKPKPFCSFCNEFVSVTLSLASGSKAVSSRNGNKGRPLADNEMRINDPKTLSAQARAWLHWGHGSLYRGDKALSKQVLKSICQALWVDITTNHKDVVSRCNRLFHDDPQEKMYLMFWRVVQLSQAGETFSASKVATYIGKHRKLMMPGTPGGDLMELIRGKINNYDLEILKVFQLD